MEDSKDYMAVRQSDLRAVASELTFEALASVNNPKSVHGIYPYRGKISAVDARRVIRQIPNGMTVLDPFCGSGTIVYEAAHAGMNAIGVDANPLAVLLTEGKLSIPPDKSVLIAEANKLVATAKSGPDHDLVRESSKHFHCDSWGEIGRLSAHFASMAPYLKACFAGAICLTARGCNWYKWTSSSVGKSFAEKQYVSFYDKFLEKVSKHHFPIATKSRAILGDSRQISKFVAPSSCDVVFTSPPYFDCLDYTSYYARIVFDILGWERQQIRASLIQSFREYENDMKAVFEELSIVMKPGGLIIFVVGDKKIHGQVINGGEFFTGIAPWSHFRTLERSYSGTSSQVFDSINKTDRREQIVMWINE